MKTRFRRSTGILLFVLVGVAVCGLAYSVRQVFAQGGGTLPCDPCNTWGSAKACFLPPPNVPPPCCDCDKNFTSME